MIFGNCKIVPCCNVEVVGEFKAKEFKPTKKQLIVGTIFVNDSPQQRQWLNIQLNYLNSTTTSFDHIVYLSDQSEDFSRVTNTLVGQHRDNISGLRALLECFNKNQEFYDYFLFLDSDAFPIQKNWLNILLKSMGNREIAVNLRAENLEQRLHGSVLFAKKEALKHLEWPIAKPSLYDLLGNAENDGQIYPYQKERRNMAFPLLRSNKVEVHPLLCGIYYNLFYHHGCGSGRKFNMRGIHYWEHLGIDTDVEKFTEQLMINSTEFINNLIWS